MPLRFPLADELFMHFLEALSSDEEASPEQAKGVEHPGRDAHGGGGHGGGHGGRHGGHPGALVEQHIETSGVAPFMLPASPPGMVEHPGGRSYDNSDGAVDPFLQAPVPLSQQEDLRSACAITRAAATISSSGPVMEAHEGGHHVAKAGNESWAHDKAGAGGSHEHSETEEKVPPPTNTPRPWSPDLRPCEGGLTA